MIQILAENNFFYVIHKPAGLSVHNQLPSVYEYIKTHKLPEHFVNRLDCETSGLMLISQKTEYHTPLSLALSEGAKIYRDLLRGQIKEQSEIWNKPLTAQAEGRKNPQGYIEGECKGTKQKLMQACNETIALCSPNEEQDIRVKKRVLLLESEQAESREKNNE